MKIENPKNLITYGVIALIVITIVSIALRKIKEQNNRGGIIAPTQPSLPNSNSGTNLNKEPFIGTNTTNSARQQTVRSQLSEQEKAKRVAKIILIIIVLFNFIPIIVTILITLVSFIVATTSNDDINTSTTEPAPSFSTEIDDGKLDVARELNEEGALEAEIYIDGAKRDDLSGIIDLDLILAELHNHEIAEPFTFADDSDIELSLHLKGDNYDERFEFAITNKKVIVLKPEQPSDTVYSGYDASEKLERYLRSLLNR